MTINILTAYEMLCVLKLSGSHAVSREALYITNRIQTTAEGYEELPNNTQRAELKINEVFIQEFVPLVLKFGTDLDKRIVSGFLSNEVSLCSDFN